VFCVFFVYILYSVIVNYQAERDRSGGVFEDAWSEFGGDESGVFEVLDELAISKDSGLW